MKTYTNSTLMSKTKQELIDLIRCYENNIKAVEEQCQNQYNLLTKCLPYGWHDLRKDPNDLPDEKSIVLFCCYLCGTYCYDVATYEDKEFKDYINPYEIIKKSLVGWTYFIKFEDNKND